MVRLILTGGLGNQMFEYAAAKSLALRLKTELIIDLYAINKRTDGTKRNYELDVFNIDDTISSNYLSKLIVKAFPIVSRYRHFFEGFGYFRDRSAITYIPDFEKLNGNIILHGHFQNESYFAQHMTMIRDKFSFHKELEKRNASIASKITTTNSVSIHVRRGDYLTDSNFAILEKEYYQKAIEDICNRIEFPCFYVFSENFEWIKENIKFGDLKFEFIDWNTGDDSYIDMQLMSLCKHNIIANSSFSWWSAWLNNEPNKTVYAPSRWFSEERRNDDLKDFYPTEWIVI